MGTKEGEQEVLLQLAAAADAAAAKSAAFAALGDQLSAMSVDASDGPVSVTVAPSGALLDVRLGDGTARLRPDAVAAMIMACVRRAQARVPARVDELVRAAVGEDDPIGARIVARYRQQLSPEEPAAPDQAPVDEEIPDSFMVRSTVRR